MGSHNTEKEEARTGAHVEGAGLDGEACCAPHQPLRVRTIEILWHFNERNEEAELLGLQSSVTEGITSVDYNPRCHRIVTTGGDGNIRLWEVRVKAVDAWLENTANDMLACCRHLCRMHTSWMPLTARWSPQGEMIASAHCDGKVCLWWRDPAGGSAAAAEASDEGSCCSGLQGASGDSDGDVEEWKAYRHLTGHISDIYDICFSADSRYLLSGAGDGSIVIHDLQGSTMPVLQLTNLHTKFCRGVAWDPWTRFLHTFGCGPSLLCFTHVPKSEGHHRRMHLAGQRKCQGDYIGESCALSYRRLCWSPDGLLLAVPYGKVTRAGQQQAPSTANLLALIEAKEKAEATLQATKDHPQDTSSPTHRTEAARGKNLHDAPVTTIGDAGDDALDDMLHCVYVYTRGAPDKIACRLGVRGLSEVRGVLWAPCFFEPLHADEVLEGCSQQPTALSTAATHGAAAEATTTLSSALPHSASAATAEALPSQLAALEAARQRRGAWGPAEYFMALAVWTSDAVIVYTTDSSSRHSDFTDLHMRSITDVAWSHDASHLYTASLDGYISVIAFGDSLTAAHRLPYFSASPAVRSLCGLLERIERVGVSVEAGRSTGAFSAGAARGCRKAGGDASASAAAAAVAKSSVAVVRKKRKVEKTSGGAAAPSVMAAKEVDMQQLEALISDI
ncbi:chromatin assembly factor 1 subunit b-like protein [Leishmania major strain Friedlin]|uniref:Chromatin assembly factor 1 subunit b-like protein n=1 Tax=Leishmania major TaxID=5664 RepID=Q4Q1H1_LEIMA|nr:chromatin assembly factor 1 subunit b-like protein [Leishmania major strain Friedlin]CAG9583782.1 chromatin_assembly_factor_1_subunit_b-like_protein [Leishmania major strain Friedlin]CAJ09208.1 chromatin assembly factor 1 subunit b-like protein [Leishmania major strain Friedlin]|eukprot:XP_001686827.1 chromatin assembly factor 1 subunit b-like protein [Leishmania major strain Friedlin]